MKDLTKLNVDRLIEYKKSLRREITRMQYCTLCLDTCCEATKEDNAGNPEYQRLNAEIERVKAELHQRQTSNHIGEKAWRRLSRNQQREIIRNRKHGRKIFNGFKKQNKK